MNQPETVKSKISARDRAQQLMNRLTAGVAVAAVAGVGALGYVSAATIPGSTSSSTVSTSSNTTTSSSSSTSSSGLQSSSGSVSSSSGTATAVSGGS
jgi:cell division septal protein FtsQ